MVERWYAKAVSSRADGPLIFYGDALALIEELERALEAIRDEPYGCVFCDSGKLRNPTKSHEDDCGFALTEAALASAKRFKGA